MKALNDRYQYGLDLFLLSIDEGITGYRDDSLEVNILLDPQLDILKYPCTSDREAEPAAVRHATQDPLVRRAVRMDYGRHRSPSWQEEQLHILRRLS